MYAYKNQNGEYVPIREIRIVSTISAESISKEIERINNSLGDFGASISICSREGKKLIKVIEKAMRIRRKDLSDERKRASAKRYRNRKAEKRRKKAKVTKYE